MKKFILTKFNICFFLVFGLVGLTLLATAFGNTDALFYDPTSALSSKLDDVNFINSATSRTVPYFFFQNGYVYDSQGATMDLLNPEQTKFIDSAIESAANRIGSPVSRFQYGNYRIVSNGLEFQLFFKGTNDSFSNKVTLVRRFSRPTFTKENLFSNTKDVNIIVPIQGRLETLKLFLDNLVKNVLPHDPYLILTIIYFNDEDAAKAKSLFEERQKESSLLRGSFVLVEDPQFSRGKGIRIGVEHATKLPFQLLFFCDVDIMFKPSFFSRCRGNSIPYHQVYYPIVFSLYNPKVVYSLLSEEIPPIQSQFSNNVDSNHGFWRHFGYGMACMHRSEFMIAGGLPELQTWGGEDEKLYNNIVSVKTIKIIRSPDDGLFHLFHHKICDHLKGSTYLSCIRSKAANEGNQMQLGLIALKIQEGVDIEGALYSWKSEYLQMMEFLMVMVIMLVAWIVFTRFAVTRGNANKIRRFRTIMGN